MDIFTVTQEQAPLADLEDRVFMSESTTLTGKYAAVNLFYKLICRGMEPVEAADAIIESKHRRDMKRKLSGFSF